MILKGAVPLFWGWHFIWQHFSGNGAASSLSLFALNTNKLMELKIAISNSMADFFIGIYSCFLDKTKVPVKSYSLR
jgi:hypothetical protein